MTCGPHTGYWSGRGPAHPRGSWLGAIQAFASAHRIAVATPELAGTRRYLAPSQPRINAQRDGGRSIAGVI